MVGVSGDIFSETLPNGFQITMAYDYESHSADTRITIYIYDPKREEQIDDEEIEILKDNGGNNESSLAKKYKTVWEDKLKEYQKLYPKQIEIKPKTKKLTLKELEKQVAELQKEYDKKRMHN